MTGHPKTYSAVEVVGNPYFFRNKRGGGGDDGGAGMCGGRRDLPPGRGLGSGEGVRRGGAGVRRGEGEGEALEEMTCGARDAGTDWGWGEDDSPKLRQCLFMRKIADQLAPTIRKLSDKILI
jgi:hypothetical protein